MRFSRNLARFVFVVCLFPAVQLACAQSIDTAAVDALVEEARKAWAVPGAAVAIVKDDQVVHLKGYGVRERGKSDPVTPDTIFNIGSTGKSFTALAVAILADEGKMSWDDPVRKHVSYFRLADPQADRQVTLRDLAAHRVGLARHDELWQDSPPLSRDWNSHTNRGHFILWHGGGGPTGFRTQILLVPKSTLGIAVISNVEGVPQLPEPVVNGILDLALGFPKTDWNKVILGGLKRR